MRYTIKDFNKQFSDENTCLYYIFKERFGEGYKCEQCGDEKFYRVKNRKAYACPQGHQLNPTAGTIFHKSSTSMKDWFFAIFLMSISKNGVAALELQRQIGVTYKTAWRMAKQIRKLMEQGTELITDEFRSYNKSTVYGFDHKTIRHSAKEFVRGDIHTNTIEGFWSQLKRSIDGTFHKVSPKHLQSYVNEFAWRYNHRKAEQPLSSLLAQEVGRSV